MKYLYTIILVLMPQIVMADSYDLLNPLDFLTPIKTQTQEVEKDTPISETSVYSNDIDVREERDIFAVLSGLFGSGLLAFISRFLYVYYKAKTGQIVVKQVPTSGVKLTQSILEDLEKIVENEDPEEARNYLRHIRDNILKIAKEKLPPKK